ncbi:MAG: carboxypeptidase regulatory-like domain-containing protein [Planctomycetes bacterium]|nr:carboxypeptidase regulatory-like domain-containing protein [Planctomycetota bacterium]
MNPRVLLILGVSILVGLGVLVFLDLEQPAAPEPRPAITQPSGTAGIPGAAEADTSLSDTTRGEASGSVAASDAGEQAAPDDEELPAPFEKGPVGALKGRVLLNSNPPPVDPIDRSSDPYFDDAPPMYSESLLLGPDTAMQNAVVSLLDPDGPVPPLPERVEVHIVDGRFVPRIALVPVGAELRIVNDDGTTYDIRGHSDVEDDQPHNPPLSHVLEGRGSSLTHHFTRTETDFLLSCARHDWMAGFVMVVDHPWHVLTDGMGRYEMPDVPAGHHTVQVWHEVMGTRETEVTVREGETADASFTFGRGRR